MSKNQTLSEFVKSSTSKSISEIIKKRKDIVLESFEQGKVTRIKGGIPLFKFEKADLTGMIKSTDVFIDDTVHKANIEFSKEGIKAAAVT